MSLETRIRKAVTPIVPVCVADFYTGSEEEYCTFNATELPARIGDNRQWAVRYLVQLHWFSSFLTNPSSTKRALRQVLIQEFRCAITVTGASDRDGRHYVYEFEAVDGEV